MIPYGKLPIILLSELASGKWDSNNCRIAVWLLEHLHQQTDISIESLARECFVSNSTISRFCREIGLEDFKDLRELWLSGKQGFTTYGKTLSPKEQGQLFLHRVQDNLQMAANTLDYAALEHLVAAMHQARRIVLLGLMRSGTAALNLQSDLISLGANAITRLTYREQMEYLQHPANGDILLIFTFTGAYFDFDLPKQVLLQRQVPLWLIAGEPELKETYPMIQVLSFCSRQDFSSHPYQLQFVASLISQRYAATLPESADITPSGTDSPAF